MINISVILCLIGGIFGIFALIKWFCILRADVNTNAYNAVPIIIGTLAWLSASVTFYQNVTYDSPVNFERSALVVAWILIIWRLKHYRELSRRQKLKIIALLKKLKTMG